MAIFPPTMTAPERVPWQVVTWGDSARGGDSSLVRGQLVKVQQIQAMEGWENIGILWDLYNGILWDIYI
jgi:hypothetical protein